MKSLRKLYAYLNGTASRKKALIELSKIQAYENAILEGCNSLLAPVSRELIAAVFLSGDGIEIGALHNPLTIPDSAKVKYVDRMHKEKLYEHYPELSAHSLVDVDIVDDGEYLNTIIDGSQDFVIANHFLEHSQDPITTIKNLLRVTKIRGVVYLAVPNMNKTFDCNRDQTKLDHILDDHKLGAEISRRHHYEEWVSLVEPHFGRKYDEVALINRVEELMDQKYSIHFHCWDSNGFKKFLFYLKNDCGLPFVIMLFVNRDDEFIVILKHV